MLLNGRVIPRPPHLPRLPPPFPAGVVLASILTAFGASMCFLLSKTVGASLKLHPVSRASCWL